MQDEQPTSQPINPEPAQPAPQPQFTPQAQPALAAQPGQVFSPSQPAQPSAPAQAAPTPGPAPAAPQPAPEAAAAPAAPAQPEPSLYDKLGGTPAITAVVNRLYDLIAQDPEIAPYFSESGMPRQGLTDFVVAITGGPTAPGYVAPDLKAVHQQYGISHEHFMKVGGYLKQAMEELGVGPAEVDTVMSVVVGTHDQVVAPTAPAAPAMPVAPTDQAGPAPQAQPAPSIQQPPADPTAQPPTL